MALVQVSPQNQDYGAYANPQWVRANTAGNVALGQAIAGVAKQAGQHFIDKAIENRAIDKQIEDDREAVRKRQEEERIKQADAKAKYEADILKKQQEIDTFTKNQSTLTQVANAAGILARNIASPVEIKGNEEFNKRLEEMTGDLDSLTQSSNKMNDSFQSRIDVLGEKADELDEWSTAKKRRGIKRGVLDTEEGTRSERMAKYRAKYEMLNTQVDDLIELNNFNIDPEVLRNVDESKIRKGDREKYYLAKALGSGDYQTSFGEDGMVFVNYKWKDVNGKEVNAKKLVSSLADNIKEETAFGFNFEMSTDEGFNKLANAWATRVGKDISRFYTKVEYPLGPGQPGVTTLDREGLKKHLSVQNDLVANLIDGFSQRAIDEIDGINSSEQFLDRALDYVIDNYIPFEGSKYPVQQQQSYSGRGGGSSNGSDPAMFKVDQRIEGILKGIKLDQDTLRGTEDTPAHSTLSPKGEGAFSILAAKYGGRVSVERSPLPSPDIEIKEEDYGTGNFNDLYAREINRQNKRNYKETISIKDENGRVLKSYNLNDATGVTRLAFDLSEEIEFTKDLEKIFTSQEQFRNYLRFKIKERIDDYNAGVPVKDYSYNTTR
jgi:hypothetical protein